jgi:cell wall-associated NlpC family hydrolase
MFIKIKEIFMRKEFFYLVTSILFPLFLISYPKKMVINVPVANLNFHPEFIDPNLTLPTFDTTNPLLITQMLMNEYLIANSEYTDSNGVTWINVNAIQQEKFTAPFGWHGYPGWIPASQATEVQVFPCHNVVIKNLIANLEDHTGKIINNFSMGTRFKAIKVDKEYWKITLFDGRNAYFEDADIYHIKSTVKETIEELRHSIIATSKKFLNSLYSWGGRIAHNQVFGNISSVDCSGMVNVCFLAHGLQIPRMSKDQFLDSMEIKDGADLQPADLIFFASVNKNSIAPAINKQLMNKGPINKHPLHIDHVMMYIGNDELIESTAANDKIVRIIDCKKRIGKPCNQITSGDIITYNDQKYYVYFSTFFTDEMIAKLRSDALKTEY